MYMGVKSYKTKILQFVWEYSKANTDLTQLDFSTIADGLGLSRTDIEREFKDLDELWLYNAQKWTKEHENRSKKITQLPGHYALSTLLRHDLRFLRNFHRNYNAFKQQGRNRPSRAHLDQFTSRVMPKYYFEIFRLNSHLIRNKEISTKLLADFVIHSLFFQARVERDMPHTSQDEITQFIQNTVTMMFEPDSDQNSDYLPSDN